MAFIVLIVRAFIFEPFRIPSDSMMPTLLDGDFIVVNKYAYGLRWPVLNEKFLETGTPQRGDVVVFRYPPDPERQLHQAPGRPARRSHRSSRRSPGDQRPGHRAESTGPLHRRLLSSDLRLSTETLGEHTHQVMSCRSPHGLRRRRDLRVRPADAEPRCRPAIARRSANPPTVATCARSPARRVSATRTIPTSSNGFPPTASFPPGITS